MRAAAVITLIAGFGLLLQTTVLHAMPLSLRPAPDILLVLCVYLGLHRHTVGGAIGAFLLGYLQDTVSGGAAGLNAFGMVLVYVLVYLTCRRLWVDNVVSKVVLVFLASCTKAAALLGMSVLFGTLEGAWGPTLSTLLVNAALAAAIAPPVFAIVAGARFPEEREAR